MQARERQSPDWRFAARQSGDWRPQVCPNEFHVYIVLRFCSHHFSEAKRLARGAAHFFISDPSSILSPRFPLATLFFHVT
jgi:hypothetical protein